MVDTEHVIVPLPMGGAQTMTIARLYRRALLCQAPCGPMWAKAKAPLRAEYNTEEKDSMRALPCSFGEMDADGDTA